MNRLTIEKVDPDLKRKFKVFCISKGSTMRDEIVAYMERAIRDADKAAKRGRSDLT